MFCTKCGFTIQSGAKFCTKCGSPVNIPSVNGEKAALEASQAVENVEKSVANEVEKVFAEEEAMQEASARVAKDVAKVIDEDEESNTKKKRPPFFSSTLQAVDGFDISEYIGLVNGSYVYATELMKTTKEELIKARNDAYDNALKQMEESAKEKGAHAVLGVSTETVKISDNVYMVCITGTAVKIG